MRLAPIAQKKGRMRHGTASPLSILRIRGDRHSLMMAPNARWVEHPLRRVVLKRKKTPQRRSEILLERRSPWSTNTASKR